MGDRKEAQFFRHVKGLAPDFADDFLRTIWAIRLPPYVQATVADQTEDSLDSASHLSERICEVTPLTTTVNVSPSTPDTTAGLLERTVELTHQVASLPASQHGSRSHYRGRHRSHSKDRRRSTPNYSPTPHDAGTTRNSGTKPESAPHLAPASRGTPTKRETPANKINSPADANGG